MFKTVVNASITDNFLPIIAKSPPTIPSSQPRLTKWQLQRTVQRLLPVAQGHEELEATFKEYVRCFKGKHQLVWSAGLRALFLVSEEEKSDEELAQETEEETILLGQLDQEQWRVVLHNNARESLLA